MEFNFSSSFIIRNDSRYIDNGIFSEIVLHLLFFCYFERKEILRD